MENKSIKLLKTLTPKEFKDFGKFLKSPFFNDSINYIRLYEYLKEYYPYFNGMEITKEKLYSVIYPGWKYDDKKLRDRLTHFLEHIKKFISYNNFRACEIENIKHFLLGIKNRDAVKFAEEEYRYASTLLEQSEIKDEEFYYRKYWLNNQFREYFEIRTTVDEKFRLHEKTSGEIDNIINFFLIVMMKEYSKMFNTQREIKIDYKFKFYEEIIGFISKEESEFSRVPFVSLLYKFISLYDTDRNEQYISELNELLRKNKNSIGRDIFRLFCIELYNYCKRMESKGNKRFGNMSFLMMAEYLKEGIFFENGHLPAHTYINLAATAIRENEIDWAEEFINKYKETVYENERLNAYNYNLAVIYYIRGYGAEEKIKELNYQKALVKLSEVKSEDFYYTTRIKNHELKIFYELDFTENLLSLIDSYNHYLNRCKLIPNHLKERYLNFVKYLEKVTKLKLKKDCSLNGQLINQIKKVDNIEYKGWLLQRIEENR